MKKIIITVLALALTLALGATLVACSGAANVPGIAWAQTETLTYDITEGENTIGTMSIVTERLADGDYVIEEIRGDAFTVSDNTGNGTKITKTAYDNDGKVIMKSICLLDGFTSLASYKMVDYNGVSYTVRAYHQDKNFYYKTNDAQDWSKVKAKSGYCDNEALYYVARCYDLNSYSSTYAVLDALDGGKIDMSLSVSATKQSFTVPYTNSKGEAATSAQDCLVAYFTKADSPTGSSISVWYTPETFELTGSVSSNHSSIFIPVKIIENNLTYVLTNAKVA